MTPGRRGPLPNFLIIGAQKSATRWLRHNLGEHPDCFTVAQEVMFFNRYYERGPDWYKTAFYQHAGERFVGEATPGYMRLEERPNILAARIDGLLPDVKLLAVLRNPIDRMHSAYRHYLKEGRIPADASFIDVARRALRGEDTLGILSGSRYAASLTPYVKRFGERLLILLHDDVTTDPVTVYRRAVAHVGADAAFVPEELALRYSNAPDAPEHARPAGTAAERQEVQQHFLDDIAELEELTRLDLTAWKLAADAGTDRAQASSWPSDHPESLS